MTLRLFMIGDELALATVHLDGEQSAPEVIGSADDLRNYLELPEPALDGLVQAVKFLRYVDFEVE